MGGGFEPEVLNDDQPPADIPGPAMDVLQVPQHVLKEGARAGSEDVLALCQVRFAQHFQNLLRLWASSHPVQLLKRAANPLGYQCCMHFSRPTRPKIWQYLCSEHVLTSLDVSHGLFESQRIMRLFEATRLGCTIPKRCTANGHLTRMNRR